MWAGSLQTSGGEKGTQKLRRFGLEHSTDDLRPMIQRGFGQHIEHASRSSCLRVGSAEDDGRDAGEDDCTRAHRARLQSYVEDAARQTPAAEHRRGFAERENLGMSSRVFAKFPLVSC